MRGLAPVDHTAISDYFLNFRMLLICSEIWQIENITQHWALSFVIFYNFRHFLVSELRKLSRLAEVAMLTMTWKFHDGMSKRDSVEFPVLVVPGAVGDSHGQFSCGWGYVLVECIHVYLHTGWLVSVSKACAPQIRRLSGIDWVTPRLTWFMYIFNIA